MDQSASVLSEPNAALLVSFYPSLSAVPVSFPRTDPELVFLVGQTFVVADKHVSGPRCYNLRVVECVLAAACLHASLSRSSGNVGEELPSDASPLGSGLRAFHELYFGRIPGKTLTRFTGAPSNGKLADELKHLETIVAAELSSEDGYTREEIAQMLNTTLDKLEERYMNKFPVQADKFMLRQRAMHVFGEALRVQQFIGMLSADKSHTPDLQDSAPLGALLDASQSSLRDLYQCSHPALDSLCDIARAAGAYGCRLTGAGWGGCCVSLVPAHRVAAVKQAWNDRYYSTLDLPASLKDTAVVESRPGRGSAIIRLAASD